MISTDLRALFPSNGKITNISTSDSSVGVPYAYEPNRMIFCG
jgi:hypothetical protein